MGGATTEVAEGAHTRQGRREPSAAAKTLIKIAELYPRVLKKIAA